MRPRSPIGVTVERYQLSSVCSRTSLWTKSVVFSGSTPHATRSRANDRMRARSTAGSYGTVMACASTMQKRVSSSAAATCAAQVRTAPSQLPTWSSPVGWMPENTRGAPAA
jgi:hypothetical protein